MDGYGTIDMIRIAAFGTRHVCRLHTLESITDWQIT